MTKNSRMVVVSNNTDKAKKMSGLQKRMLGNSFLFTITAVALLVDVILLISLMASFDGPTSTYIQGMEGLSKYKRESVCKNGPIAERILISILSYHGLTLLCGLIIAVYVRQTAIEELNEANPIVLSEILVLACVALVGTFVGSAQTTHEQLTIMIGFGLLTSAYCTKSLLFVPKVLNVIYHGESRSSSILNNIRDGSSGHRSALKGSIRMSMSTAGNSGQNTLYLARSLSSVRSMNSLSAERSSG